MKSWWTGVFAAIFALLVVFAPAAQAEDAESMDFSQRVDTFFGDYPNYYLGKVMFFDVVFFDVVCEDADGVVMTLTTDETERETTCWP